MQFAHGRQHTLTVDEQDGFYLLRAIVVRQSVVSSLDDLPVQAWLRNRTASLVGFRIDQRGRLFGEAWVPKVGLGSAEFQLYVRTVAVESDRFEYHLTGKDLE